MMDKNIPYSHRGGVMKRLLRSIYVITMIAFTTSIATTLWAAQSTKPNEAVATPRTAPKIKKLIKPMPAGTMQAVTPKPDLQVGVIKVLPQNPGEGQEVTFEGNVMNYGIGAAPNPVVVMTVAGPAGTTFPTFRKEFNVTLTKNQGVTFVQKFTVPKQGNYTCTFRLDPARMIAETNDNNNQKNWTFGVHALPDLIVCVSNGKRPPVGGKREIKAVVKNIGHVTSNHLAETKLRFYIKNKGTQLYDIPPLSPGQSHIITRNHSWGTSGTKTITAKIIHSYNEISSQNNEAAGSYFVRLPHHDKYGAAPQVKCSTNVNFNSWAQCDSQY